MSSGYTDAFFELTELEPSFLPNLTSLNISAASMHVDYLGLVRFLRARTTPLGCLASVELIVDYDPEAVDLPSSPRDAVRQLVAHQSGRAELEQFMAEDLGVKVMVRDKRRGRVIT
ncbi:hypothetical protein DFH06DRAFT_1345982 [Mycena polygramma]|nr:hypothetical protein DFH06DRAFT_1345982 [Mycena polygramma]